MFPFMLVAAVSGAVAFFVGRRWSAVTGLSRDEPREMSSGDRLAVWVFIIFFLLGLVFASSIGMMVFTSISEGP